MSQFFVHLKIRKSDNIILIGRCLVVYSFTAHINARS